MAGIGIGISPYLRRGGGVVLSDPEANAFFARLVDDISDEQKQLFTSLFIGTKQFNGLDSISEAFDYAYFFGGLGSEDNAKLNAISSSFPIVYAAGTPTWANTGYTGGAGKALKNGYTDSVNAVVFGQNDGFIMVYITTEGIGVSGGTEVDAGNWVDDNTAINTSVASRYSGSAEGQINIVNRLTATGAVVSSAIGLTAVHRIGNNKRLFRDTEMINEVVDASTGVAAYENHFLAALYGGYGSIIRNSTKEQYFAAKGKATTLDIPDFSYRFDLYKNGTMWYPKATLGTIFSDDFARASVGANYVNSGAFSCNGTNLVAANTSGGMWDKTLTYDENSYVSCLEKSTQVLHVEVDNTASVGVALSYLGEYNNLQVAFRFDTGKIVFYNALGTNTLLTSTPTLTINNGDQLQITIKDHKGRFKCTVYNVDTDTEITSSYTYGLVYAQTNIRPSYYQVVLHALGGTQNITLWSFTADEIKNADLCFVGDSNFFGFYANYQSNSIPNRVGLGQYYSVYGGPGLKTSDINWDEIAQLNPTKAVIMLGTNDIYNSVPSATAVANLAAGVATLEAAGITCVLCKIPPLDTQDVTTYNNALVTEFGAKVGPDLFTLFKGGGFQWNVAYNLDGIHIGPSYQEMAATEISANI